MLNLMRDIGLSFCPAWVRNVRRPNSQLSVLRAAIITGALQACFCVRWFLSGFMAFLFLRSQQYGNTLQHQNESTQAWLAIVFFFEYLLFHPIALLLFYLSLEGFIRFIAALSVSEVVPSLPIVLGFTVKRHFAGRKDRHRRQALASIPDSFEVLADGEHLRIAASQAKTTWNAALTIGVDGAWYEVEREETGIPPREYVYFLKRAPVSKMLRGYEEYNLAVAIKLR
jgi:hypothetical protein